MFFLRNSTNGRQLLKDYVERSLNSVSSEKERDEVEVFLTQRVTKLLNTIGVDFVDWNNEPLPM